MNVWGVTNDPSHGLVPKKKGGIVIKKKDNHVCSQKKNDNDDDDPVWRTTDYCSDRVCFLLQSSIPSKVKSIEHGHGHGCQRTSAIKSKAFVKANSASNLVYPNSSAIIETNSFFRMAGMSAFFVFLASACNAVMLVDDDAEDDENGNVVRRLLRLLLLPRATNASTVV